MTVLLLGDSNAYRSIPYQPSDIAVEGHPGYKAMNRDWPGIIADALSVRGPVQAVIVQLGTNDASTLASTVAFPASFDRVMRSIPATMPVIWNLPRPAGHPKFSRHVGRVICGRRARYPNLHPADLPGHWAGHPEWMLPDDLHFTPEGYREYVRFNAQNLASIGVTIRYDDVAAD